MCSEYAKMPGLQQWVDSHDDRRYRQCDRLGFHKAQRWRTRTHKEKMNISGGLFAKGRDARKRRRMEARRACREERRPYTVPLSEWETMEDVLAGLFLRSC